MDSPTYTVDQWLSAPTNITQAAHIPDRLVRLVAALRTAEPRQLSTNDPPATRVAERQAAVLILLSDRADGPTVTLLQRSNALRDHPGEIAFPGGSREPTDRDPTATALREAAEEIGLEPSSVDPVLTLPRLHIRASGFDVTTVGAVWREAGATRIDPAETCRVFDIALSELGNPHRWHTYRAGDWIGPATLLDDTRLWGYTAEVLLYMAQNC